MRTALVAALFGVLPTQLALAELEADCPAPKGTQARTIDPGVRKAAQRGLDFLVRASRQWTEQHKCYGCHVQAVTLEGLTVGRHNKYDVSADDLAVMVGALELGVTAGGRRTGVAFQGAAWARYDQWIDGTKTGQLLRYAEELIQHQQEDGAIPDDDRRPPVVAGTMQTTYQAMQTWRQAYARTADDAWLPPMRRAEGYLARTSRAWTEKDEISLLDLDYALMGLVAAGVKASEPASKKLQRMIVARQNKDGGFGLEAGRSDALATGQALYALKLAGYDDTSPQISRGQTWLATHQRDDGGWGTVHSGQSGADKGEAMWAVLGLVSVDVMSISVAGLNDGQRLDGPAALTIEAQGVGTKGVRRLELQVDDRPVATACGGTLRHVLRPEGLSEGKHRVEIHATNAEGQVSHQVLELYTGDVYMTEVGVRFDEQRQQTQVSLRNIAGRPELAGSVQLEIETTDAKPVVIHRRQTKGTMGAMTLAWDGRGNDGKARGRGRYRAKVSFLDAKGRSLQTEQVVFLHDTRAAQKAAYAEVEGRIGLSAQDNKSSANTLVELVDDDGNVVQSTRTTAQGNYRFKNVDQGKYRVRVKKEGWKTQEAEVDAKRDAAPAAASISL